MKSIQSTIRAYIMTAILCSTYAYPQTTSEWLWENKKAIAGAVAVVGTTTVVFFGIPKFIKHYHNGELLRARTNITQKTTCNSQVSDSIKANLASRKKELEEKWKLHHQFGISISGSTSLPARCNIANALCLNLTVAGDGILSECIAAHSTNMNGDIIAHSCQFKGNVSIDQAASFASFTNCLLGNVQTNNTMIELCGSVVEGNITFNKPGIIIVDNQAIIGGTVTNGTVMHY